MSLVKDKNMKSALKGTIFGRLDAGDRRLLETAALNLIESTDPDAARKSLARCVRPPTAFRQFQHDNKKAIQDLADEKYSTDGPTNTAAKKYKRTANGKPAAGALASATSELFAQSGLEKGQRESKSDIRARVKWVARTGDVVSDANAGEFAVFKENNTKPRTPYQMFVAEFSKSLPANKRKDVVKLAAAKWKDGGKEEWYDDNADLAKQLKAAQAASKPKKASKASPKKSKASPKRVKKEPASPERKKKTKKTPPKKAASAAKKAGSARPKSKQGSGLAYRSESWNGYEQEP